MCIPYLAYRLWDLLSGHCLNVMEGHSGEVISVILMDHTEKCVSASTDGTLKIWSTNTSSRYIYALICEICIFV